MEGESKRLRYQQEEIEPDGRDVTFSLEGEADISEQAASFEALDNVAASAGMLEVYMKERTEFSRQLFTPSQAEAFRHSFEMASESIKAGDVDGFNQELSTLDVCFEGYGTNVSEGIHEDLNSLGNVKKEFKSLRKNFDTFANRAEELPGVNLEQLDYMRARFEQVDDFHDQLYEATEKFQGQGNQEYATQETELPVDQEQAAEQEKRFYFGRMIEDMSDDARGFGSKIQQRYENNITQQLMSPQDARMFVRSLESAADAMKHANDQALTESFDQMTRSFSKYGTERGMGATVREDPENLRATMRMFSDFNEKFSQFAHAYQSEQLNPELSDKLQRIRKGFSRIDSFNRSLTQRASQSFDR